jgi:uncharacterized membrane protein YkoI
MKKTKEMKMPLPFRSAAYLALASAIVTATPVTKAMAGDDEMKDAEALKQAIKQGEIRSLPDILAAAREKLPAGQVVGAEIEQKKGRWVYEFEVVGDDGQMYEAKVDAKTAEVGKIEEEKEEKK